MEYKVTYSNRKTIGIYVHSNSQVEVRCPQKTGQKIIEEIVNKKKDWIESAQKKLALNQRKEISESEKMEFIERANSIIPEKVRYFSKIMKVEPSGVRIGNSKSYWGCCSGNNKINFSWRLMQASDDVIDYVVVHELAHIKEHNHSKRFWAEVGKVLPNYKLCVKKLKELE